MNTTIYCHVDRQTMVDTGRPDSSVCKLRFRDNLLNGVNLVVFFFPSNPNLPQIADTLRTLAANIETMRETYKKDGGNDA